MTSDDFKSIELSGKELDEFIKKIVDRVYDDIWSDLPSGMDRKAIKGRLKKSIIAALKEYAEYR